MIARQVRVETVVEVGVEREIVAEHGGVDIGEFRGALLVLPVSDASQPDDEREQRPREREAREAATFTRMARSGGAERARRRPCPGERGRKNRCGDRDFFRFFSCYRRRARRRELVERCGGQRVDVFVERAAYLQRELVFLLIESVA